MSFNLTRKTDYALVALAALAEHERDADKPAPQSARQLAQSHDLPLPLLMNVLKDLHRAGIVHSRRGAGGGYLLNADPADLTLLRIVEATEGPVQVTLCCDDHAHESEPCACQIMDSCSITEPMRRFNRMFERFLSGISLKDLMNNEMSVSLTREGSLP